MVTLPVDEDLGLVHQPPEGHRVHHAVPVTLPARTQVVLLLGVLSPLGVFGKGSGSMEPRRLVGLLGHSVEEFDLGLHDGHSVLRAGGLRDFDSASLGLPTGDRGEHAWEMELGTNHWSSIHGR